MASKVTKTNLYVLASLFGAETEAPNRVAPADLPHLRRCLRAGLVEVSSDRSTLSLTQAGAQALAEYRGEEQVS